ncbi:MAG: hypothetical protein H0U70_11445 [Tatlockia sp.]|nr:hypothetical protein [Tatlockia sp.]
MQTEKDIKILLEMDKEILTNKHYPLIQEVDNLLSERFPYGLFNRVDTIEKLEIPAEELQGYFSAITAFQQEITNKSKRDINKLADISQPLLLVQCEMMTSYAIGYLQAKYPKIKIECLYLGESHTLLVLGRAANSNPLDIKTWGKEAVLCDYWARFCIMASNFESLQKTAKNIPFYNAVVDNYTNQFIRLVLHSKHHLAGKPEIEEGALSASYDKVLVKWVAEDQKRFKQPALRAPLTSIGIIPELDPAEVKSALGTVSKCSSWKFNQKQGVAWLECKNQQQSERLAKSLDATKAAVISSGKNNATGVHTVKCAEINLGKLARLAQSLRTAPSIDLNAMIQNFSF